MFQRILHRAESAIESSIGSVIAKGLAVVPFLIAAGFAAAALSQYLTPRYGPEGANLILAALFAGVGVVAMIAVAYKYPQKHEAEQAADKKASAGAETGGAKLGDADKELIYSALTALAPMALPRVAGLVVRNLPIIAAVVAAAYLATRASDGDGGQRATAPPPAE